MDDSIPSGTVTFLFTDIEGSTVLWESDSKAMKAALKMHDAILCEAIESREGYIFSTGGDAFCAAFERAADALEAAVEAQQALEACDWSVLGELGPLRVRTGLHSGEAYEIEGNYFGNPLNRVARLMSAAHGGQILLSLVTQQIVRDSLPEDCTLRDWGEHPLKDLRHSEHIFQVVGPDLPSVNLPPATESAQGGARRASDGRPEPMLDEDAVWEAVRIFRHPHQLAKHPLTKMHCVTLYLLERKMHDSESTRCAALRAILLRLTRERLDSLRKLTNAMEPPDWPDDLLGQVQRDYASDSKQRWHLSALYAYDLSPQGLALQALLDAACVSAPSTIQRHRHAGARLLLESLLKEEAAAGRALDNWEGRHLEDRLRIDPDAPQLEPGQDLDALMRVVRDDREDESFTARVLASIASIAPADLEEYWLGRIAEWSQERFRLDARFVQLSMIVDLGEEAASGRWKKEDQRHHSLESVLDAMSAPATVVLGAPGAGKSTLLRHFELHSAEAALKGEHRRITFFVPLARYGMSGDPPDPHSWLEQLWAERFPSLPRLGDLMATGEVVLLLDALNEMPHSGMAQYRERILRWKGFVQETVDRTPNVRIVFSCRSLDYSAPLSTPALRVPQVRIEPLNDEKIQEFLRRYLPEQHEAVWSVLSTEHQHEVFRSPYLLRLLVDQVWETDMVPEGRAALFTGFVRKALRREIEINNPEFEPPTLLSDRDYFRIVNAVSWPNPYALPEHGPLFPSLSRMAFDMQRSLATREMAQVRLSLEAVADIVGASHAERIVSAAVDLSVLTDDRVRDEVMFVHQLLQEYFAARYLHRHFDPELVRVDWLESEVQPTIEETIDALAPADPLPPLPSTGWEETTILASAMSRGVDAMIGDLLEVNLPLAGRCAAQAEVQISDELDTELRWALVQRGRDPEADLRARIEAACALDGLDDPRFTRAVGPEGDEYLLPPMVEIPGGTYTIGTDDPESPHERPLHRVRIEAFSIARFPVTNAEWARFMESGGYDDERWWRGKSARAWHQGEGTAHGMRRMLAHWIGIYREQPERIERGFTRGLLSSDARDLWLRRIKMSDRELAQHLEETFPGGILRKPLSFENEEFGADAMPVVGISWYEARAYCAWLSANTSMHFRLPTSAEWEASARGQEARTYAYGNRYDARASNTVESRIRVTTPVGIFPSGDTPEGISDMSGNVLEWTSTAGGRHLEQPDFKYPYNADDGREEADLDADVVRIARGGNWAYSHEQSAGHAQGLLYADGRELTVGFRLAAKAHSST